ncbi:hypothetical protein SLL00_04895 [Metabacillus indicus]|uniref:hypothetical protein n=1 Tax=Metabacillus indicus TaxID=246786 RepID=UPI002A043BB9|nr:hypothetical protein [Metabacillus indicus]MDX8289114.1 hypothetical protein [Metabacillus indicus]
MEFGDYLKQKYHLGDTSVKDYIGRWNSIVNKGLYRGETELTPTLIEAVDREYPKDSHYRLTLKRYFEFKHDQKLGLEEK